MSAALDIVGHEEQRETLLRIARGGSLHSAMLFSGVAGIGKKLVALEIARTIMCLDAKSKPCGKCDSCRAFESGNVPDLHRIDFADKDQGKVEAVRELLYSLNLRAFQSLNKVVIFDNAEEMSLQAANILLKSFEEPRPDTYFIMTAANPYRLPATLLSRCQIWHFQPLNDEQVQKIVAKLTRTGGEFASIAELPAADVAALADGTVDGIQETIKFHDFWKEANAMLQRLSRGEEFAAGALVKLVTEEKAEVRVKLRLLATALRRAMKRSASYGDYGRNAVGLQNVLVAQRLISERNLNPIAVMQALSSALVGGPALAAFTASSNDANLLENFVV